MKALWDKLADEVMVILRYGRRKVRHTDQIIADNARLIKQIRMHRMNFYRHYKRAATS